MGQNWSIITNLVVTLSMDKEVHALPYNQIRKNRSILAQTKYALKKQTSLGQSTNEDEDIEALDPPKRTAIHEATP